MDRKKFLIIRFSSIGDIVLTTPVIRCLKEQMPEAIIHYLTKIAHKPIVDHHPYLEKVYYLEDSLRDLYQPLKAENYDYIIDLHHNLRSLVVKKSLRVKSFSFNKINFQKWMAVNLKRKSVLPAKHIVDRYLNTLSTFDIQNDGKGLDYFIPPKKNVKPAAIPKPHQKGYIGFVIGAKHTTKRLPTKKIISICEAIKKPVILIGGNTDRLTGEQVVDVVGNRIYNGCGLYGINGSASLVKQADKVITHDTGLMHIAAAFQKNIISIWGNTIPEFGMYPYFGDGDQPEHHIVEVKDLSCRPCSKIGFKQCPHEHFDCMEKIDEQYVASLVNQ